LDAVQEVAGVGGGGRAAGLDASGPLARGVGSKRVMTAATRVESGSRSGGGGGAGGGGADSGRWKAGRSTRVVRARAVRGAERPAMPSSADLPAEVARASVTSTKRRPPASTIGRAATCCQKETARVGRASVIICWWPTDRYTRGWWSGDAGRGKSVVMGRLWRM
jgi:hypothetical protein